MSGPLSNSVAGASYKGAFGTTGGDIARAAASFAGGQRAQEEERQKQAMAAALQALKTREVDQGDARIKLDTDKFGYDQQHDTTEDAFNHEKFDETKRATGVEEAGAAETRGEIKRHDIAGEGIDRGRVTSGRPQLRQTKDGFQWFYPGSDTTSPVVGADGKPVLGQPGQGEFNAKSSFETLKPLFSDVKGMMAKLGAPPNVGQQFALDQSRTAPTGIMGSLENILGNKATEHFAPEYQALDQAITGFTTVIGQMVSGQAISEPEAQRLRTLVGWRAGDTPEKVQLRLKEAEDIINAAEIRAGRLAGTPGMASPTTPPAAGGKGGSPEAKAYYDSLRSAGKSADEALQMTDAKYPR